MITDTGFGLFKGRVISYYYDPALARL